MPPQHGSGNVTAMIDDHVPPAAESTVPRQGLTVSPLGRYAIGVAAAVVGLLPWLLTGMRLPLQNLWAQPTSPEDMPLVLLPFNQYFVVEIAALLVVGGAGAGAVARRYVPTGLGAVAVGLLGVQAFAVVQTAVTVGSGLGARPGATPYLAGLVALSVLALAISAGVMVLLARAPRAGALVGAAIAALLLASWLHVLVAGPSSPVPPGVAMAVVGYTRWLGPVAIGAAIAWCGLRTTGRVAAAVGALVGLWLVPPFVTATAAAVGSRVLARDPAAMAEYGAGVFRMAATMPALVVPPLAVAVVAAVLGLLLVAVRRRAAVAGPQAPAGVGRGAEEA